MAEQELRAYAVQVNTFFILDDTVFRPGFKYEVPPAVYNGTVEGKGAFKDLCASASPVYWRK